MNEHENRDQREQAGETPQEDPRETLVGVTQDAGQMDDLATRALLARPGLSIRARFIIGFLVIFFAAASVTVAAWVILFRLDDKLEFVDRADKFANEIQQCRRYEKNFFLYGTVLSDALKHLDSARRALNNRLGSKLRALAGGTPANAPKPAGKPKPPAPRPAPPKAPTATAEPKPASMDEAWAAFCEAYDKAGLKDGGAEDRERQWFTILADLFPSKQPDGLSPGEWGVMIAEGPGKILPF